MDSISGVCIVCRVRNPNTLSGIDTRRWKIGTFSLVINRHWEQQHMAACSNKHNIKLRNGDGQYAIAPAYGRKPAKLPSSNVDYQRKLDATIPTYH